MKHWFFRMTFGIAGATLILFVSLKCIGVVPFRLVDILGIPSMIFLLVLIWQKSKEE